MGLASSADGSRLAALGYGAPIYLSSDGGSTWVPSETSRDWYAIAVSADGTKLIAGAIGGKLYVTSSAGMSWTAMESNRTWAGVTMSANGNLMAAAASGAQIYTAAITTPPVLTYTPLPNASGTPYTTFTFQVEDSGPSGSNLDPTPRTFTLNVTSINDAPSVANPIPQQNLAEEVPFVYQFSANTFADADSGDVLSYTATLESGGSLPAWLSFDGATRTFTGTPGVGTLGTFVVKVIATDNGSPPLTAETLMQLMIGHPPEGADGQITVNEDVPYVFTPADFGFLDPYDTPPNNLRRVKINTLPAQGVLALDGFPLQAGEFADLTPYIRTLSPSRTWSGLACSADGSKLFASTSNGALYTSYDFGASWVADTEIANWNGVFSSSDGAVLLGLGSDRLRQSRDAGSSWITATTAYGYLSLAGSSDAKYLVTSRIGPGLATSYDGGTTWEYRSPFNIQSVASSADGFRMVACAGASGSPGYIYTSSNAGSTWSARGSSLRWASVASSSNGEKLVALPYTGPIYTSSDYGVTWVVRGGSKTWKAVASSADGTRLIACELSGQCFISKDSGITWTAQGPIGTWSAVAASADGTKLLAAASNGPIYLHSLSPRLSYTPPQDVFGTSFASFTFQVEDDGAIANFDLTPNTIVINVSSVDDPPLVTQAIPDQVTVHDVPFSFQVLANTFSDVDAGSVITYSASGPNGETLPAWLFFDPVQRTFSGTPTNGDVGKILVKVTATDNASPALQISTTFTLVVTSYAPTGTTGSANMLEEGWYLMKLSDYGFSDPSDTPPNQFTRIKLSTLPRFGQLTLENNPVVLGQMIPTRPVAGLAWASAPVTPLPNVTKFALSSDGIKAYAATTTGIQSSVDGGGSWNQVGPVQYMAGVCCSADGTKVAACPSNGQMYLSSDSGQTWAPQGPPNIFLEIHCMLS